MLYKVFINRTGDKIGHLTAIECVGKNKHNRAIWRFKCDCGNEKISDPLNLRRNPNISCGCTRKNPISKLNRVFKAYRNTAKRKGLEFSISREFFDNKIQDKCHYCGIKNKLNGIDRLDSSIGYIECNCVTACKSCNIAKNTLSYEAFVDLIKRIYVNLGQH